MASTNSVGSSTQSTGTQPSSSTDTFSSLGVQDFVKMLVAQLQNQDPMDPVSNSELLQQVSQMRSIASSDNLDTTLQSVLLGQNVATAGSLINQTVTGTDSGGNSVTGMVDSVSIANGVASLHIGANSVDLSTVSAINPSATQSGT